MADPVVGKPRRRRRKPSAQKNAQKSTQSNCVGMKTVFNPPIPLYTYDHFSGEITDLYAGDISVDYFLKNIITPVAELAYDNYKTKMRALYGLSSGFFMSSKAEYIRKYNKRFIEKSDAEHIKSWKNIVEWTSASNYFSDQLEPVVLNFVDRATETWVTSPADMKDIKNRKVYSNGRVNAKTALHDNLIGGEKALGKRNLFMIQEELVKRGIRVYGSNIGSYNTTTNSSDVVNLVALNDKLTGLGILCNGTLGYKIEVISYTCLGPKKGEIHYRYTIYDHFGLDEKDLSLTGTRPHMKWHVNTITNSRQSFLSWFYLQRVKGYKPVITKIVNEYTFSTEYEGTKYAK